MLDEKYDDEVEEKISEDDAINVLNFNLTNEQRLHAFLRLTDYEVINDIISRLTSLYSLSGTTNIQNFLYTLTEQNDVSSMIKSSISSSLLSFYEQIEPQRDPHDSNIESNNMMIIQNNEERKIIGYKSLYNTVISFDDSYSTTTKIYAIMTLMESNDDKYIKQSMDILESIIENYKINIDYRYKTILSINNRKINKKEKLMLSLMSLIFYNEHNDINYRLLSAQYILVNNDTYDITINTMMIDIATNDLIEYNIRADAADILHNFSNNEHIKKTAYEIIVKLGDFGTKARNIYQNAQNVHKSSIEKSVISIIEKLVMYRTKIINDNIDYDYIYSVIMTNTDDNYEKIKLSLNRILIDRAVYTKYNVTLRHMLVLIYKYIIEHEYVDELLLRLKQELIEMCGTCSSGFISRLCNVLSGYTEFSVSISFEDQLVARFAALLNSFAMKITDENSIYHTDRLYDVVNIYLNKRRIVDKTKHENINIKKRYDLFLKTDKTKKIKKVIENFQEDVLNEMMEKSSSFASRQSFLLFFGVHMLSIREQLYEDYKEYIKDTEFDLYIRKAISNYEGVENFI